MPAFNPGRSAGTCSQGATCSSWAPSPGMPGSCPDPSPACSAAPGSTCSSSALTSCHARRVRRGVAALPGATPTAANAAPGSEPAAVLPGAPRAAADPELGSKPRMGVAQSPCAAGAAAGPSAPCSWATLFGAPSVPRTMVHRGCTHPRRPVGVHSSRTDGAAGATLSPSKGTLCWAPTCPPAAYEGTERPPGVQPPTAPSAAGSAASGSCGTLP